MKSSLIPFRPMQVARYKPRSKQRGYFVLTPFGLPQPSSGPLDLQYPVAGDFTYTLLSPVANLCVRVTAAGGAGSGRNPADNVAGGGGGGSPVGYYMTGPLGSGTVLRSVVPAGVLGTYNGPGGTGGSAYFYVDGVLKVEVSGGVGGSSGVAGAPGGIVLGSEWSAGLSGALGSGWVGGTGAPGYLADGNAETAAAAGGVGSSTSVPGNGQPYGAGGGGSSGYAGSYEAVTGGDSSGGFIKINECVTCDPSHYQFTNLSKDWSFTLVQSGKAAVMRTTAPLVGKVYCEFASNLRPSTLPTAFGIDTGATSAFYNAGFWGIFSGNGGCGLPAAGLGINGAESGEAPYAFTQGDRIGIAVDVVAGKMWFSKNGVWILGNPATGADPSITFPPGSSYRWHTSWYSCNLSSGDYSFTIYPRSNVQSYAPPSGFAPYGNICPLPTVSACDQNFADVLLLLHGEGSPGSQVIVDSSTYAHTPSSSAGSFSISNAQKVYGDTSIRFEAGSELYYTPGGSGFSFGSGDFTIEFWIYNTNTIDSNNALLCTRNAYGDPGWQVTATLNLVGFYGPSDYPISGVGTPQNQWTAVAFSQVGSVLYSFQNGVLVDTRPSNAFSSTSPNLHIGRLGWSTAKFSGYLEELRITKGVGRYTENYTPTDSPYGGLCPAAACDPSYSEVSFLLHFDASFADSGPSNHPIAVGAGGPTLTTTRAKFGKSAYFTGAANCYVDVATTSVEMRLSDANWTLECWFYQEAGSQNALIGKQSGNDMESALYTNEFRAPLNGLTVIQALSWSNPADNAWHHIALTRAGVNLRAFVDGVMVASRSDVSGIGYSGTYTNIGIGSQSRTRPFKGYIDEVRWSRNCRYTTNFTPSLTEYGGLCAPVDVPVADGSWAQTKLLMHADAVLTGGVLEDFSAFNLDGLLGTAVLDTTVYKWGGASLRFNGSGRGATFPIGPSPFERFQMSENATLELWMREDDATSGGGLFSNRPSSSAVGWSFNSYNVRGYIGSQWHEGWLTWARPSYGVWHHMVLQTNGSVGNNTIRVFIDGVMVASRGLGYIDNPTSGSIQIGSQSTPGEAPFKGNIDEVRYTRMARYPDSGFTPPTGPFANA